MSTLARRPRPPVRALRIGVVAVAALVAGAGLARAQPAVFRMDVSPREGNLDDTFVVVVQIEVAGVAGVDHYWDPVAREMTLIERQGPQGGNTMTIDPQWGRQLRTTEIRRYYYKPKRIGRLEIEPAKIRLDGEEYETRRAFVTVRPSDPNLPPQTPVQSRDPTATGGVGAPGFVPPELPAKNRELFLHVVVDQPNPYLGEQVIVTWMLYTRGEVLKFEPRPPRLDGLWSEKLYEPDAYFRYHDDVVDGIPYQVAIVSKRAVFPTQVGKLEIKPYVARVSTLFAPMGESAMVESKPVVLDVKPLPDGAPKGFDPTYVGTFEVSASVDRAEIDAGDSMTLTLTVRAEGAIRRTTPPVLETRGFQFRTPRDFDESVDTSTDRVRGVRTYRYWATPEQGGRQSIPSLTIPYFDPHTGSYEIARTDPIAILVHGDPRRLDSDRSAEGPNFIAPDIHLIRTGDTIASVTVPRLYRKGWFWLLAALPALLFGSVVVTDRVRRSLRKDTPRARVRRARGRARKRLRVADIHMRGDRPSKFFAELAGLIYDHLEERVGHPVHSMTRDELREFLAGQGFAEHTIEAIDQELQNCDFARFAPAASGPGEMRAARERTRELLREIEKTRTVDQQDDVPPEEP